MVRGDLTVRQRHCAPGLSACQRGVAFTERQRAPNLVPTGQSLTASLSFRLVIRTGSDPERTGGDGMIDLMQQLEVRAVLAEKDREARAALRVSEAKSGPRGLTAGFGGRLAQLGIRVNRMTARFWLPGGLRGPP